MVSPPAARRLDEATSTIGWIVLSAIAVPALALVFWNTWSNYSYWLDELWSVSVSTQSWAAVLSGAMRNDVHPPLYQFVLKLWIGMFGTAEGTTRALSGLFAAATLVLVASYLRHESTALKAAVLGYVATAPAFAYYGQETRSYALLLLLATAVTLMSLRPFPSASSQKHIRYVLIVLLSLTHYFGLIYAGIILLFDLIRAASRKERYELVLVGTLMLVWPLLHVFAGGLLSRGGGNFWIKSSGPLMTIKLFLAGAAPAVGTYAESFKDYFGVAAALLMAACVGAGTIFLALRMRADRRRQCGYVALLITSFVALLVITDLHTPMSTPRNYIVLIPAVALVFGFLFDALFHLSESARWRRSTAVALTVFLISSAVLSYHRLTEKWEPHQNWKVLGAELVAKRVCESGCDIVGGYRMHTFYFDPPAATHPETGGVISAEQAVEMAGTYAAPIIGLHSSAKDFEQLRAAYPAWKCYEPPQGWRLTTYVMTPQDVRFDRLFPCREHR
jgi:hypothetical protein